MQALVTGVAGFIGSHLAEALVAEGHTVRGVDGFTPYYAAERKEANVRDLVEMPGFELLRGALQDADLSALMDGIDVVFHLAGQPGIRSSWADFDTYVEQNITVTHRLLEAAVRADVRRLVYASSSSVYGDADHYPTLEAQRPKPQNPYGVTKLAAEHLCQVYDASFDMSTASLRYFTVFGPRQRPDMAVQRVIEAALDGHPFPLYGDGSQVRDFTFVDNVVNANLLAASAELPRGVVLNIAGGAPATLREVIDLVTEITGRAVAIEPLPVQPGDAHRTGGDATLARDLLGWKPTVGLADGIAAQVRWFSASR